MPSLRFRPKLIPALGTACLLVLFIHLGLWQAGKGERALAAKAQHAARAQLGPTPVRQEPLHPEDVQDAPLVVTGSFDTNASFFIDNKQLDGKPGLHVITPLRIEGGNTRILVNRGWIGWGQSRAKLPIVETPTETVTITGIAALPSTKGFFLMPDRAEAWPELWSRLDMPRYIQQSNHPVQPVVLLQTSDPNGTPLVQKWPPPEDRAGMHQSYAMQWFGMALALTVFFVVASTRRQPEA